MEMMRFIEYFYPNTRIKTFFESCGIADLVTTCYGGRNRKVCEAFAKTKRSGALSCVFFWTLIFPIFSKNRDLYGGHIRDLMVFLLDLHTHKNRNNHGGKRERKVMNTGEWGTGKPLYELEAELLKGQSAQGPLTAAELYDVIKTRDLLKMFPLFEAVHNICIGQVPVEEFIGKIRNHPEYEDRSNAEFH
ncbi:unnamed protein product [Meloidogyne enterolobii]|uniref:Uncharacterized protein n=1 Tax=Meloidogyne enterolobii TaxID=390850 RepID=A0ACB1ASH7_MELEN